MTAIHFNRWAAVPVPAHSQLAPKRIAANGDRIVSIRACQGVPPNVNPGRLLRPSPASAGMAGASVRSTHSLFAVNQLRLRRTAAAIRVLTDLKHVRDPADRDRKVAALTDRARALAAISHESAGKPATAKDLQALRDQMADLRGMIASVLPKRTFSWFRPGADPEALLKQAITATLNEESWQRVSTTIVANGQAFDNSLVPAAAMSLGNGRNIFPVDYEGKGVSCASTTHVEHATNLWISRLTAPGAAGKSARTLFEGVRHGILSPYGLPKGSPERLDGAVARAREVVTAALLLKPEALQDAIRCGTSVHLKLSSTSLVTPINLFGNDEKTQLADQVRAWRTLAGQRPLYVQVRDGDGRMHEVAVKLEVAAFNFGVNELALKVPLPFRLNHSDELNRAAFGQLLGALKPGAPIGGWAGEHLADHPRDCKAVTELVEQIREIVCKKRHHADSHEPYALPQRVMRLTGMVGGVPAYNCKSGKDRTGMADTMAKAAAIEAYQNDGRSAPFLSKITADRKALHREVMLNSGNMEIQSHNTGAAGNKVMKTMPLPCASLTLVKDVDKATFDEVKGLSRHV